ncbi:MAG: hypothetical protein H0U73_10150 [Tatlockia sp.]|nr:hypothetical protein [Tatlockia sp.]
MIVLYLLIFFILLAFVFDRTCLWLEHKGWLYYRKQKPKTGIMGSALQELNAQLLPSKRHAIVVQEQEIQCKKSESGSSLD